MVITTSTSRTASAGDLPALAPAATTGSVPLSSSGNARIEDHITVPATCLAPSVLVNPNGSTKAYIAVSGWKS
jgi:hypothetical protein